jgi:TPR repeat protein
MKITLVTLCLMLFFALQAPAVLAKDKKDALLEADQYYLKHDFKKAYKMYYKLAKSGDHYSQERLSHMFANGEGKSTDLTEAYAWSVLAAEGGMDDSLEKSESLLQQTTDKESAEKRAAKLKKKYGEVALRKKAEKMERIKASHKMGGCTGSRVGCSSG